MVAHSCPRAEEERLGAIYVYHIGTLNIKCVIALALSTHTGMHRRCLVGYHTKFYTDQTPTIV